ncbi:urease accessory protein UreD [Roseibium sp. CAU 1637]|uniref:Urease accessory protein UreD n=1 Tax=Roseibium limicola TaxID=2816037 RepID=A0A939EU32_9HYPH|nr:urease accessory protein UreD [Roseibium limicola]MBO0347119.1 urease accessory protein UreD [Roseibium limicola]
MLQIVNTPTSPINLPDMQRARGIAHVSFKLSGGRSRLDDLYQAGSSKVRLPRVYDPRPIAVLINTAGGITGGDSVTYEGRTGAGSEATITTQAAERAYRRSQGTGLIDTSLIAETGSTLEWLPQETIIFDHSALARRLRVDLLGDARFLGLETTVLGRTAMGETVEQATFRDSWRIHRDGRLIFADDIRLSGNTREILSGAATGQGAIAFATLVDCCPNAEDHLPRARQLLDASLQPGVKAGASAWNGVLSARFVAPSGRALRETLMSFLESYRDRDLPRVWRC